MFGTVRWKVNLRVVGRKEERGKRKERVNRKRKKKRGKMKEQRLGLQTEIAKIVNMVGNWTTGRVPRRLGGRRKEGGRREEGGGNILCTPLRDPPKR
jgi:hypothetical protein